MLDTTQLLPLLEKLIALPSVTPHDAGCQTILKDILTKSGFTIEQIDSNPATNFWAKRGNSAPLFVFAGHTDVVPAGLEANWTYPPFTPTYKDGYLFGRGTADMKGAVAAMVIAAEQFVKYYPQHTGSIGFLITSAEEGPSEHGTPVVLEKLREKGETITWCLVGEPTSEQHLGDTIKIGRRGSLNGELTIYGKQGHIAYPHLADNAIHKALPVLAELTRTTWDNGNQDFQPTQFQISNLHAGTGAVNVIPGEIKVLFNLRYSPEITAEQIQERIQEILLKHKLTYTLTWNHSGKPYYTSQHEFISVCSNAIQQLTGITPKLSTHGGTSDARYIAATGCEIVEFGLNNSTMHQINEYSKVADLILLSQIYFNILEKLLTAQV